MKTSVSTYPLSESRARWMLDLRQLARRLTEAARLMVGVPDYDTYVHHRETAHPGTPIMTYEEFFRERQLSRYAIGKGKFRGCC